MSSNGSKASKRDLYLIVSEERRDGYFHLVARVSTDRYENGERVPYGLDDSYDGEKALLYSGLRAACQGDQSSQRSTARESAVYGYGHVEYRDVFGIDLRDARRMTRTLEHIERRLAKLSETRGYARSYGEFLGRLAEALGCKGMAFQQSRKQAEMSGYRWRWATVGEGVNEANNAIWRWQREAQEQAEVAQ